MGTENLPPDPELDAMSWEPTVEEADAYLRGHGVIKKCEACGQDATLTNNFVTHLVQRHSEIAAQLTAVRKACKSALEAMDLYRERHLVPAYYLQALAQLRAVVKGE